MTTTRTNKATFIWVNNDTKFCPICKTWFPRPRGKSNKVWKKQICCGRDCSSMYRRKDDNALKFDSHRSLKATLNRRKELNPGDRRFVRWY